ncbi:MAG: outer membrane protein assembly factor BamD [Alphaproteobacteria bacterium]|nr:outer membrane protein assembly factor BamD [Alphaproteobacteria bacterium]
MKKIYGVLAVFLLAGCAAEKVQTALPVENLYNNAFDDLQKTKYKKAAEEFEQVEIEHPYSQWAVKAKLMGAYAYYKNEDYDDAVLALDRFIKYHPGNKDVAYAYYLKGMCYYSQISSADKDQADTEKAEEAFNRLITLFPNSEYAADARKKVNLTEDYKAGQEMIIGRYYLNNGNYLSALNRFNVVLENYQTTVQIEEALYRQVEIYGILGLNKYADGYYKILRNNYPDGVWTAKAAKVMEKIGNAPAKKAVVAPVAAPKTEEVKEENSSSWFSWFKSDMQPEVKAEAPKPAEEVKEENSSSWFSWFKSDMQPEVKAEAPKPAEEVKEENSSSWFSWFKSDEQPEVKAETPKPVEEVKEETSSSWFSWFKSNEQPQREEEDTSSSWFSWFKSDEQPDEAIEEIAVEVEEEQPQAETVKTEEKKPVNSVKVSHKAQVGDIISSSRKGKE